MLYRPVEQLLLGRKETVSWYQSDLSWTSACLVWAPSGCWCSWSAQCCPSCGTATSTVSVLYTLWSTMIYCRGCFVLSPRMVSASCRHSRTTSIQTTPLPNTLLCMRSKSSFFPQYNKDLWCLLLLVIFGQFWCDLLAEELVAINSLLSYFTD